METEKELVKRQLEVMNLVKLGNSNKQIGRALYISEQTVKNHISAILRKLNANDRAHAVYLCMRRGIID